jgi:hypothetical protein
MDTEFLDWALADFSGYVAADELYDGPFCVLSAVDNRCYKRILYDVLDHDPTHDDIRAFLRRLQTALAARDLTLRGITTDGSALYPAPLREGFGKGRHHICQFHVIKDIVKAVVGAVARARKGLAAMQPKLPKGRPSTSAAKAAARTKKRLAAQGAALFTHRYLFVQRRLNTTARKTLWRVSRGLPQLHGLRAVMDQVYALCDRRCRTQTALDKLATLRRRLLRFPQVGETLRKLFSPTLDKALTFLDDKLLPSTSNAVERGIGAIARCKRVSTGCGRKRRSVRALRWICGVKPTPKAGNKPSPHCIVHGLAKPGVFTTVSRSRDFARGCAGQSSPLRSPDF